MSENLALGDLVHIVDNKKRRYSLVLKAGGEFQNHKGNVKHESIIGQPQGSTVESTRGQQFIVVKPTLSDFIISMPRGAQIIYPKDIGAILMLADIAPGLRVFESGVGSGALSSAMLRVGANITGYEIREDFAGRAKNNVEKFLGQEAIDRYDVEIADSYEGLPEAEFDRVVLDLPEPWNVVPHVPGKLAKGGVYLSYSPSVTQIAKVDVALKANGFSEISVTEVLHRTWHVDGQAVRPDHRMVAHTGFLTRARL